MESSFDEIIKDKTIYAKLRISIDNHANMGLCGIYWRDDKQHSGTELSELGIADSR